MKWIWTCIRFLFTHTHTRQLTFSEIVAIIILLVGLLNKAMPYTAKTIFNLLILLKWHTALERFWFSVLSLILSLANNFTYRKSTQKDTEWGRYLYTYRINLPSHMQKETLIMIKALGHLHLLFERKIEIRMRIKGRVAGHSRPLECMKMKIEEAIFIFDTFAIYSWRRWYTRDECIIVYV